MRLPPGVGFAGAPPAASDPSCDGTPPPLRDLVGFQLRRAHMLFALHWQLRSPADPARITPVQAGMLMAIDSRPGLTQAELARLMDVEGPTLVRSVDRLVAERLVQRIRRPGDRRSYALRLTTAGHRAMASAQRFVAERDAELLAGLSPAERAMFLDFLTRIVRQGHVAIDAAAAQPGSGATPTELQCATAEARGP